MLVLAYTAGRRNHLSERGRSLLRSKSISEAFTSTHTSRDLMIGSPLSQFLLLWQQPHPSWLWVISFTHDWFMILFSENNFSLWHCGAGHSGTWWSLCRHVASITCLMGSVRRNDTLLSDLVMSWDKFCSQVAFHLNICMVTYMFPRNESWQLSLWYSSSLLSLILLKVVNEFHYSIWDLCLLLCF